MGNPCKTNGDYGKTVKPEASVWVGGERKQTLLDIPDAIALSTIVAAYGPEAEVRIEFIVTKPVSLLINEALSVHLAAGNRYPTGVCVSPAMYEELNREARRNPHSARQPVSFSTILKFDGMIVYKVPQLTEIKFMV